MNTYLLDKDFLAKLDLQNEKEIYAKIISLDIDENPIEEIQGTITGGSLNVDGSSAVRRTCSLSMVAKDIVINDYYWGLKTKFKLEIGVKNKINPEYPDILWFPQGTYVISSFSESLSVNTYTINISGKDKMVLLNGEMGGTITASSWDFGTRDEIDENGTITNVDIPIKTIIRDAVHEFAKEPFANIIINDLDTSGIELMEYRGNKPLYLLIDNQTNECRNVSLNPNQTCYFKLGDEWVETTLGSGDFNYDPCVDLNLESASIIKGTIIYLSQNENATPYRVAKVEENITAGYRATDLTYAGDLTIPVGGTVTQMLDKLVGMLGEFEYYYDIDGRFVFQKKKIWVQTSFNNIVDTRDQTYVANAKDTSAVTYTFEGDNLISAVQNTPNLANLRNDYSLWGTKKSVTGQELPVHLRYAIDKKPFYYKAYDGMIYTTDKFIETQLHERFKDEAANDAEIEFYKFDRKPNPKYPGKEQLPSEWWYMSDWYNYYRKLTGGIAPTDYIRFYATNRSGDQSEPRGYVPSFDATRYFNYTGTPVIKDVWLFHLHNDVYNFDSAFPYGSSHQHNGGSGIRESDGSTTVAPFSGCTAHKYGNFVTIDEETGEAIDIPEFTGFFYKPDFPAASVGVIEHYKEQYLEEHADEYLSNYYYFGDWREIIYQMALDYNKHHMEENFEAVIAENNILNGESLYPTGVTGYEQYYVDVQGFWRQLYCGKDEYVKIDRTAYTKPPVHGFFVKNEDGEYVNKEEYKAELQYYITIEDAGFDTESRWATIIATNPETINFWFDFLDSDAAMAKYATYAVGDRSKAVNDNQIKAIYFRETPTVIFFDPQKYSSLERLSGYTYIQCPEYMETLFKMSGQGKSAQDVLDTYLYNYAYCVETISLTSIPVYYLIPNTRIFVNDTTTGINGEYILRSYSVPLAFNGTMNISAVRAPERLY